MNKAKLYLKVRLCLECGVINPDKWWHSPEATFVTFGNPTCHGEVVTVVYKFDRFQDEE